MQATTGAWCPFMWQRVFIAFLGFSMCCYTLLREGESFHGDGCSNARARRTGSRRLQRVTILAHEMRARISVQRQSARNHQTCQISHKPPNRTFPIPIPSRSHRNSPPPLWQFQMPPSWSTPRTVCWSRWIIGRPMGVLWWVGVPAGLRLGRLILLFVERKGQFLIIIIHFMYRYICSF